MTGAAQNAHDYVNYCFHGLEMYVTKHFISFDPNVIVVSAHQYIVQESHHQHTEYLMFLTVSLSMMLKLVQL